MISVLLLPLFLQITPVQPLPKANPSPPPVREETGVMAPVNALFAAIAARDGQAALATAIDGASATTATEAPDGTRKITRRAWADFAAGLKPGPEKFEERLFAPAIEVDGDVALVWGRYDFYVGGKLHHCGYDHFDLVREGGHWKIANITWSSRTTGCEG